MCASLNRKCWSRHPRRRQRRPRPPRNSKRRMKLRAQGTVTAVLVCAAALLLTAAAAATVSRSTVSYQTPDVSLVRQDGRSVSLPRELDDGRPVLLNFIFTTCSSVCPLTSRTLEERSEEHTSELQSQSNLVCRLLLEKKKQQLTN